MNETIAKMGARMRGMASQLQEVSTYRGVLMNETIAKMEARMKDMTRELHEVRKDRGC